MIPLLQIACERIAVKELRKWSTFGENRTRVWWLGFFDSWCTINATEKMVEVLLIF